MAKKKAAPPPAVEPTPIPPSSGYTVLARRYRPQLFNDLVGQEPVARALINAIQTNRVAHAYIFTGPRGVGKTSAARILAKALNCSEGPTATPCGKCEMCKAIAEGDDVDVIEIDGASNNKVDEIRELRSNVQYRPAKGRFKIYIIDEVHMLTTSAFNALLKTLEEPPAHVKFIFATTEIQKVPVTILSRCQRFDFAGIGTQRIVQRLREVVAGEGKEADDDALELVARRAGGSMRDSQSLLDQLLAFGGERLTADQVHQLLGTAHDDRVTALAAAILDHDARKTLELLGQGADQGLQLAELLDQLIDYWRDLMIGHCTGKEGQILSVGPQYRDALLAQASQLKLDTILAGLDILSGIKARMRGSGHGRILMEMGLVRLGRLDDLVSLSQLAQWLGQAGTVPAPRPAATPASLASAVEARARGIDPAEAPKKKPLTGPETAGEPSLPILSEETLPKILTEVVSQIGPMLGNYLSQRESLAISGPNTLVLRFSPSYNSAREHCQDPNSVRRIEEAFKKITGRQWNLRVESAASAGGASSVPQPGEGKEEPSPSPPRSRRLRQEAMQKPLVKSALDLMGAQIIDVEEGFGDAPETPAIDLPPDEAEEA